MKKWRFLLNYLRQNINIQVRVICKSDQTKKKLFLVWYLSNKRGGFQRYPYQFYLRSVSGKTFQSYFNFSIFFYLRCREESSTAGLRYGRWLSFESVQLWLLRGGVELWSGLSTKHSLNLDFVSIELGTIYNSTRWPGIL